MQMPVKQKIGIGTIEVEKLRLDGGTQPREKMDDQIAYEYGAAMRDQGIGTFEPVIVYYDGSDYWLADGFHRVTGAKQFGVKNLSADIRQGTRRDAVLFSSGANGRHGLRRTNADKHRAVEVLLRDDEWRQWSDHQIAKQCGVSVPFVGDIRAALTISGLQSPEVRTGADGRSINTGNIGGKPKADPMQRRFPVVGGLWYPLDTIHRIIYNDPRDKAEAIPTGYRAELAARLLIEGRYEAYRFVDSALPAPEPNSLFSLLADRFYPVSHTDRLIYNDAFESLEAMRQDKRYDDIGGLSQTGILLNREMFSKYQLVDPLPIPAREVPQDQVDTDPPVAVTQNLFEDVSLAASYEIPVESMPALDPNSEADRAFAAVLGEEIKPPQPDPRLEERREVLSDIKAYLNTVSSEIVDLGEFSEVVYTEHMQNTLNRMVGDLIHTLDSYLEM